MKEGREGKGERKGRERSNSLRTKILATALPQTRVRRGSIFWDPTQGQCGSNQLPDYLPKMPLRGNFVSVLNL